MTAKKSSTRFRVGRVSYYQHHGSWYLYYRDNNRIHRLRIGRSETEAERAAALKNAELTAGEVSISQQPALALPLAIHFTLAKTGLRPGELTHTLIEDLDLDVGWLRARGKPELGWNVKTGTDRDIPLAPEVIHVLRQLIGDRSVGPVFRRVKITLDNPPKLVECLAPPPAGRRGLVFSSI